MKLESVEIPAPVTDIELGGFSIISAKTILFAPGSKLKSIGGWGFNGFRGEEIILPEGLKYLGECAFQGSNLKSIDLPASLMTAMGDVFNLKSATIIQYTIKGRFMSR